MLITVGMMAYNEAKNIHLAITSLLSQSVFTNAETLDANVRWEILVVPNGCTDNTHDVAQAALVDATGKMGQSRVQFRVVSLTEGGKSRSWNELVHRISQPETAIFVMVDSDIAFGHADTILNVVKRMMVETHARVVVDLALKDFTRRTSMSWVERLSAKFSKDDQASGPPAIAGSFYCAMAPTLRSIWMPVGLSVEDGFLYAMVATNNFREPMDPSRVVRAENATHYFEGLTSLTAIIDHEVRLMIGTALNAFLCWDALLFLTPKDGAGAGDLIRQLNANDALWYPRMMRNEVLSRGWWVLSFGFVKRRWPYWLAQPWRERLRRLPLIAVGTAFDLVVMLKANRRFAAGKAIGHW
jgi:glycosyltransferase involved in cell wall biosynthesis